MISPPPPPTDPAAGWAMLLSPRLAAARKPDREQLSCRYGRMDFETPPGAATLTVVVVYVPHQQRVNPSQAELGETPEGRQHAGFAGALAINAHVAELNG
eukprot:COSAG05_NODE_10741_length_548_cov_1.917595_1_plen_99_part_01